MSLTLPAPLDQFLIEHAEALDTGATQAAALLPMLGAAGLLRRGVPTRLGGDGSHTVDALDAIAAVSQRSLAAGFVFWGQRAFIEYLLQSDNEALGQRWLPELLSGQFAGATGLSNAMKFLSGIEPLQVRSLTVQPPVHGEVRLPLKTGVLNPC